MIKEVFKEIMMQVVPNAKDSVLLDFAKSNISMGSTVHSDAFRSYNALSRDYCCDMQKYDPKSGDGRLKWLYVMIPNIKQILAEATMVWTGLICSAALTNSATALTGDIAESPCLTICWRAVYGHLIRL